MPEVILYKNIKDKKILNTPQQELTDEECMIRTLDLMDLYRVLKLAKEDSDDIK